MLNRLSLFVLAGCAASAAPAQIDLSSIPEGTHDWGCEVLLCLANPAGPKAAAPCVPPIERLWRELARGHAFPSCAMASSPAGHSYARPAYGYYDRCPQGTAALQSGQLAALSAPFVPAAPLTSRAGTPSSYVAASDDASYTGIGEDTYGQVNAEAVSPLKVCVAGYRGTRMDGNGENTTTVQLYDTMWISPAQSSPRMIDVFIDDAYWQTVRW